MTQYRDIAAANRDRTERYNGHVAQPRLGAMREIYIAESDAGNGRGAARL